MPISHKHKFKFIHIPKTGGSSIEVIFDLQHQKNLFIPAFTDVINGCHFAPQHYTHELVDHFSPASKDWFSFTIVRNPYTKILSEYFYINKNFEGNPIHSFDEKHFIKWIKTSLVKFDMDHKLPQVKFINKPVDMVLKFENIEEDFKRLNAKLNTNHKLVHLNRSSVNKSSILKTLCQPCKDLIYDIFREDFTQLNYTK